MATSSDPRSRISVFNGKDYPFWKHMMKLILDSEGLYAIAFDENLDPTTDDEKYAFLLGDQRAKNIIRVYLDERHIQLTEECYHARDIIDKLDVAYGQKNLIARMLAEESFYSYRMRSTDTMAEHLDKVQDLAFRIRDAGGEISDVMIMARILGSLHRKYHDVREIWLTPSREKDTLQDLKAGLLREEQIMLENERMGFFPVHPRHHHHDRRPSRSHHHHRSTHRSGHKHGN